MPHSLFPIRGTDLAGMANSALCLVHCLAAPVIASTGAHLLHHPWLTAAFIGLAAWAVWPVLRTGAPGWLQGWMVASLAVFSAGMVMEDVHPAFFIAGLAGSASLVLAHAARFVRLSRYAVSR